MNTSIPLFQTEQIKLLEQLVMDHYHLTEFELMERAGSAAFKLLRQNWPLAHNILVFCGKGNNGGDGYVVARLAKEHGLNVLVHHLRDRGDLPKAASVALQNCLAAGVDVRAYVEGGSFQPDVIVDAVLGIGLKGDVKADCARYINVINQFACPVLALDVPSGIDIDTGSIGGCAVQADSTITFLAHKQGLMTGKAAEYAGELHFESLGASVDLLSRMPYVAETLGTDALFRELPRRAKNSHKSHFGHVLVVGGNIGMAGAVRLAGEAAARVGAGLVSIATRVEHASVIAAMRPELMCHGIESTVQLDELLTKATILVIGAGLGQDKWARMLLNHVLAAPQPKVVDADALNLLAKNPSERTDWILTPHPGEASRLLHCSIEAIEENRFLSAQRLQEVFGGVAVLKGLGTLVQGASEVTGVCTAGNPGMASGGMGDVLGGTIGGLLAQGLSLEQAARMGVLIHSIAADTAVQNLGERGLLASDLMLELRKQVNCVYSYHAKCSGHANFGRAISSSGLGCVASS